MSDPSVILIDLSAKVGELTGLVKASLETAEQTRVDHARRIKELENDVDWLKSFAWKMAGALVVLSLVFQLAKAKIAAWLGWI